MFIRGGKESRYDQRVVLCNRARDLARARGWVRQRIRSVMRIQSIDTVKGLAIFAVVLIHTDPFLVIPSIAADWYYLGQALQELSSFAVPFFFVAAGYFFSKGISKEGLSSRWWKYTSRLSVLLVIWIVIDGIAWDQWLEQIISAKSLSPLLWNLSAIPSFAINRPDLFLLRGTAVPLWFLVSLIIAVSLLALCLRLSLRPSVLLLIGLCAYGFNLVTSAYAETALGIGLTLPLEQRGPFIAFAFLSIGHWFSVRSVSAGSGVLILLAAVLMVFVESALLSHFSGQPFQERPYLLSTILLAGSAFLVAIQNPALGSTSIVSKIGARSLGIYFVHTPVLGAVNVMRTAVVHPIWEIFFPLMVLMLSYGVVKLLMKVPFARSAVAVGG